MAEVTKPIALDESFNTTESTPRNTADVLAEGLDAIATAIENGGGGGGASTVSQLTDVLLSSTVPNGDVLVRDNNLTGGKLWKNKSITVEMTQAEYNAIVDFTPYENTHIVITDAPNLNPTASDIEYSSGVSVADELDDLAIIEQLYNQNSITVYKVGSVIQMCFSYAKISDIASMFSAYVPSYNVDYPIWNSTKTQFSVLRFNSGNLYVLDTSNWSVIPNTSSDGLLGTITFFNVV